MSEQHPPLPPVLDHESVTAASTPEPAPAATTADRLRVAATKGKELARSFAARSKAAGEVVAKLTERSKLTMFTLPNAYRALGKHVYGAGSFRAEFTDLYGRVDTGLAEIVKLSARPTMVEGLAVKAKAVAKAATNKTHAQVLQLKVNRAFTELGKAAFDKHGDKSGPAGLTNPILDCFSRLETLAAEIAELSKAEPGTVVTPKRIAIGGLAFAALLLLLVVKMTFLGSRTDERQVAKNGAAETGQAEAQSERTHAGDNATAAADAPSVIAAIGTIGGSVFRDQSIPGQPVTSVFIHDAEITTDALRWACKGLPRLKKLVLSDCKLRNLDGLQGVTSLEELTLGSCDILTNVNGLKGLTSLKSLQILCCDSLTNVDALQGLVGLEYLSLTVTDALRSVDAVRGATGLKYLSVSVSSDLSDRDVVWNMDLLQRLTGLETLTLNGFSGFANVDAVPGLTGVKELDLSRCRMTNADVVHGLAGLEELDLSFCDSLVNLDGLKGLTRLQELNLSYCYALTSVYGLQNVPSLKKLNLSNCGSLSMVLDLLQLTSLQELDLTYCPDVSKADQQKLLEGLPNTIIRF